jgi:hypothetical protein
VPPVKTCSAADCSIRCIELVLQIRSPSDCKCLEVISVKRPRLGHVTPGLKMFLTVPLIFNGPLKFLSILCQTHSYCPFHWNTNNVNIRSIPNYTDTFQVTLDTRTFQK